MPTARLRVGAQAGDALPSVFLDGADAVMLSGETSVGAYPIEAVRTMPALSRTSRSTVGSAFPAWAPTRRRAAGP